MESPTLSNVLNYPRTPKHGTPKNTYPYEFIQFRDISTIETDVVIIGSGCGGGVAAKNIADAGYKVIVAEKAYHWSAEHLPMTPANGNHLLYMNGGVISCTSRFYELRSSVH